MVRDPDEQPWLVSFNIGFKRAVEPDGTGALRRTTSPGAPHRNALSFTPP